MSYNFLVEALVALAPNHAFIIDGEDELSNVTWKDIPDPKPSDADIITKCEALQAEWNAQAYARNREKEYPSIAELTVALYDTDDKAAIETKRAAVKTKYPKPS